MHACAGDLLYFPRGTVHQAVALEGGLSHHLTGMTGWSGITPAPVHCSARSVHVPAVRLGGPLPHGNADGAGAGTLQ